jgi:dephospho-CoA kinase
VSTEQQPFNYAIALTGGIATGKSSVSKIFEKEGFTVIDADSIAHQVLNESVKEVASLFGDEVCHENGVNRKILGTIVFQDIQKRKALEALLHPLIHEKILQYSKIEEVKKRPYLIDIPLFFETARYNTGRVIVVYATRAQQIERGMIRDHLSKEEILCRISAQIDIEEKRNRATYLIDNSGDKSQLYQETLRVIDAIKKDFS